MKKAIYFITGLFLIAFTVNAVAQEPQEPDALYHQIIKEYTIHADGSYDLHYFKKLELKSHFAFNRLFGETFVVYNPDFQELEINKAYTIMADGSKNPSPERAFNEVLPRPAQDFPEFSHLKEMVITHTGLEVGATIHLDYTLKTNNEMFNGFAFQEQLRKRVPVKEMKIIVHAPEDYKLKHHVNNLRLGPEIEKTKSGKTYTWLFKSLPARIHEGHACEAEQASITILGGGAGIATALDIDKISYKLPATLSKKAKGIAKENKGAFNQVMKSFEWLKETIDESYLPQAYMGKSVRHPEKVWKTNVGNTLERSVLLASMIRATGTHAVPVVVLRKGALPVIHSEDQIMVKVDVTDGVPVVLSVNDHQIKNHFYGLGGKEMIPLEKGKTSQRISVKEAMNEYDFEASLTLTPDTLYGEGNIKLQHVLNPFFGLQKDNETIGNVIKGMPAYKAELKQLSPASSEGELVFAAKNSGVLEEMLSQQVFTLPAIDGGVGDWNLTLWDKRISTLEIPYPVKGSIKITIELEDMECLNRSFDMKEKYSFGNISANVSVKGSKVIVSKEIEFTKKCFNPIEYNELRDAIRIFEKDDFNKLVFRVKE
jgi:hypothetical protein